MRRASLHVTAIALVVLCLGPLNRGWAGPGTVVIPTDPSLGLSVRLGGQVRVIPTYERNWDLGLVELAGLSGLRTHVNEAGALSRSYIRTEDRLYFNVSHGEDWDFYMALEFDSILTQRRTDRLSNQERGLFDDFGVERLNASVQLPWILSRLHAGWDTVPSVDLDAGGFVYVDDDPAIWLAGKGGPLAWKLAYVMKNDANFVYADRTTLVTGPCQVGPDGQPVCPQPLPIGAFERSSGERNIWAGRVDYTLTQGNTLSLLYVMNNSGLRGQPPTSGITALQSQTHYPGLIFSGNVAGFKPMLEVAGSFGSVDYPNPTAVTSDYLGQPLNDQSFDIRSFAAFADLAYDASTHVGFKLEPHVGMYWLKGDKNPADKTLGGFTPVVAMPRFNPRFGGENSILADGNVVYGSPLYSIFPENLGNQSSLMTNGGGLFGFSRSDNPGLTMIGGGVDTEPLKEKLRLRTNAYALRFNSDILVGAIEAQNRQNASNLGLVPRDTGQKRLVTERFFGVEWDNELTYFFNKAVFTRLQLSFLFPGPAAEQIAGALADVGTGETRELGGVSFEQAEKVDAKTMRRFAVELVWNF